MFLIIIYLCFVDKLTHQLSREINILQNVHLSKSLEQYWSLSKKQRQTPDPWVAQMLMVRNLTTES